MTHLDHDSGDAAVRSNGRRGWRRWTPVERTGFVSAVAGAIGVVVAVLAWLLPMDDATPTTTGGSPGAPVITSAPGGPTGAGPPTPPPAPPSPALRYLNTIEAETGAANLRTLPRALAGLPGYDHPIVIGCPTNQTGDKVRQVSYPLRGRYLDLTATVRPYFTRRQDQDGKTRVRAHVGTRQPDDTMTTVQRGLQFEATTTRPGPLKADVERGDLLTLAVECEFPDGVIVLADAGLTPAA